MTFNGCLKELEKIVDNSQNIVQKFIAIEELSELNKEITKDLRGNGNKENIKEEIADVYIMLSQLIIIYEIDKDKIDEMIEYKINRTKERLGIE